MNIIALFPLSFLKYNKLQKHAESSLNERQEPIFICCVKQKSVPGNIDILVPFDYQIYKKKKKHQNTMPTQHSTKYNVSHTNSVFSAVVKFLQCVISVW